jgi:hypothetical protein
VGDADVDDPGWSGQVDLQCSGRRQADDAVALENFDHLNWISETSRDELFEAQVELLILAMGAKP